MQRLAWFAILFFVTALSAAETRPRVVTSFFPLHCWALNVAGDHAQVDNLLPPRAEPHEYAFAPADVRRLQHADLIVVNGLGLEAWLPKFTRTSPSSSTRIVIASAGVESQLIAGGHEHGHVSGQSVRHNPHLWLDPQLAVPCVRNIAAALQRADGEHAAAYAANAQRYADRLLKLDAEIRQALAGKTNRALVTYHDAFPYFARRYGLEIAGVVEEVPDVNPTPKYLSRLARTMRERDLRVIFIAPNSTTRLARRIAEDLRVELVELDTLESGPLSPSAYEERMRANAAVLRKYLK